MIGFDVPYDLRVLAKTNLDRARAAYDQIMSAVSESSVVWLSAFPQNETTARLKAVQERAIRFGRSSVEASFDYADELVRAKDLSEVISMQRRFSERQIQNYSREVRELGALMMAGTVQDFRTGL